MAGSMNYLQLIEEVLQQPPEARIWGTRFKVDKPMYKRPSPSKFVFANPELSASIAAGGN